MFCYFIKNCRFGRFFNGLGEGVLGLVFGGRGIGVGDGG